MKKYRIDGNCPYCGAKDSVRFADYYYGESKYPYAKNIPVCKICDLDEIEIRKINNRRYKVVGKN